MEERAQFLDIYEQNLKHTEKEHDSSEFDVETTRKMFRLDLTHELTPADKVIVVKGEL